MKTFEPHHFEARNQIAVYRADSIALKALTPALHKMQDILGPAYELYCWSSWGGWQFVCSRYGDHKLTDPLEHWRSSMRKLTDAIGKPKSIEVSNGEYPDFRAMWELTGYDTDPWWYGNLNTSVRVIKKVVKVRMDLREGDCELIEKEVTRKEFVVNEMCASLAKNV